MNTNDNLGLNPNASHVSTNGEPRPDTSRYTLTIEEASALFAEAGVPRSPRSITRFCKDGHLECIRVDTEKNFKYLIDRNSVEKRITELKQAVLFASKTYRDTSSHVELRNETQQDMSSYEQSARETDQPNEEVEYLRERVEELEADLLNARIDNAGKEQFINQMAMERKELITQVKDMSYQLGAAQTKLQQLEAPRPQSEARHVETAGETIPREAEVVPNTASAEPAPAPTAQPAPEPVSAPVSEPEKRTFLGRIFGR